MSAPPTAPAAADASRLFEPFLDAIDMVCCCPATTTLAEVNRMAQHHGLRFPLLLDADAPLLEHMAAAEFAPGSARFGPWADNVLGMNWTLPSGHAVRAGERVVKSSTGYDLLRFLLHSDGRYGRAREYVLRLRPAAGETFGARFSGPAESIDAARRFLLGSSWNHWIDAIDLVLIAAADPFLELTVDCIPGERAAFAAMLGAAARAAGAEWRETPAPPPPGLPAFTVKTTVSEAPVLAAKIVQTLGGHARVLALNGAVLAYPDPAAEAANPAFWRELREACAAAGGHLSGRAAPPAAPDPAEAVWAAELETAWSRL